MKIAGKRTSVQRAAPGPFTRGLAVAGLLLAGAAQAADPDLGRGEQLLQAGQLAEAIAFYEQALEADPGSIGARLGLGRAYYAQGDYARARSEFETVLRYDNLAPDLLSQADTYNQMAEDYAAGQRWQAFYYAETGVGHYRENSSEATDIFGGAGDSDTFLPIRVGGGWSTGVGERHTFNSTLDYRFRSYDESSRRNDSDLRWNFNLSRPIDDDSLRFGMRGRVSYRGDGQYRNDWGAFGEYRLGLGDRDELTFAGPPSLRFVRHRRIALDEVHVLQVALGFLHDSRVERTDGVDPAGRAAALGALRWITTLSKPAETRPVRVVRPISDANCMSGQRLNSSSRNPWSLRVQTVRALSPSDLQPQRRPVKLMLRTGSPAWAR